MEDTTFKDLDDYFDWYAEYFDDKLRRTAEKNGITEEEVFDYLINSRKGKGWPKGLPDPVPSRQMNTVFDDSNEMMFGNTDVTQHTRGEGEEIVDSKLRDPLFYLEKAVEHKEEYPDSSFDSICQKLNIYKDYKPGDYYFDDEYDFYDYLYDQSENTVKKISSEHTDIPEKEIEDWVTAELNSKMCDRSNTHELKMMSNNYTKDEIDKKFNEISSSVVSNAESIIAYEHRHTCSSFEEAATKYNELINSSPFDIPWVGVDQFRFDKTGLLVTGNDSSTALQGVYEEGLDYFTNDVIKSENWKEKSEILLVDAQNILNTYEDFVSNFASLDGELGEELQKNLRNDLDDVNVLKTYVSENIGRATDILEILKAKLEEEEKINKEIENKQKELDSLKEPEESIEKTNSYKDSDGTIKYETVKEHNPEHDVWENKVTEIKKMIEKLNQDLIMCLESQRQCLADLKVLDEVVIKYHEISDSMVNNYLDK